MIATTPTTTDPQATAGTVATAGVWGLNSYGQPVTIPVIGVTGKYHSGKTLFMLSIAPGNNRTKLYDFEMSANSYGGMQFEHVDAPARMRELFGTREYRPIDMFRWWKQDVFENTVGSRVVIAVDPITDIQSGLTDYVASQYAQYGFTSEKAFTNTGGIFWAKTREYWKRLLADLATRCEVFTFSTHLKKEWVNGKATAKDKPGGLTTLLELSSLYLWLDRSPDAKTGAVAARPRCVKKLKDRVSYTSFNPETMEPIILPYLPPAFNECTPMKIREYLSKPADYNKLKANERVVEEPVSEMDKLELERQIAESKAEAEASALERLRRQTELRQMAEQKAAAAPQAIDQSGQAKAAAVVKEAAEVKQEAKVEPSVEEPPFEPDPQPAAASVAQTLPANAPDHVSGEVNVPGMCTPEMAAQLTELKSKLGMTMQRFQAGIAKHTGGSVNPLDLSAEKAREIIKTLTEVVNKNAAKK